jgi:hypothetical protein
MLCYGIPADAVDEYCKISETVDQNSLDAFTMAVVEAYSEQFLRPPSPANIESVLESNAKNGWIGQTFSMDVMHWAWKNCLKTYAGQYVGKDRELPTIALEAMVGPNGYIWYANFGFPGSLNDLNILDRSPLIGNNVEGKLLPDIHHC